MEGAGVVDALGRVRDMVQAAIKDLSPEELLLLTEFIVNVC